jgi:hypothetical protein
MQQSPFAAPTRHSTTCCRGSFSLTQVDTIRSERTLGTEVRTRGEKRANRWVEELCKWAEASARANRHSADNLYFGGVLIAISLTKGTMA